jgi:hypothetical protein
MTPKEKAEQLVHRMMYRIQWQMEAKDCSLIAVDEIIDLLSKDINPLVNYWFEVKKEIQKL